MTLPFRIALIVVANLIASGTAAPQTSSITLRGHTFVVRTAGPPDGDPVVVSSGDGGWTRTCAAFPWR